MADQPERVDAFQSPVLHAAVMGTVAVLVILGLALWGGARPSATVAALGVIAVATWLLMMRGDRAQHDASLERRGRPPEPDTSFEVYRRLLEILPEPVLLAGLNEGDREAGPRLLFANAAARELFNVQREGGPLAAALRHPQTLDAVEGALAGEESHATMEVGGAQARVWRARAAPAMSTVPGLRTALVTLHDDTDVRRAERTRADFLANASHELRTPLASIAGFIETLSGPARDDPAARERFLQIMGAQAGRMARLIEDLLSLSRIELNEHIAPEGEVDLSQAVRDVVDALGPRVEGRPELRLDIPPIGQAMIRGDYDQIVQVAQNLVDNAIKYAGPGGAVNISIKGDAPFDTADRRRDGKIPRLTLLEPDNAWNQHYAILRVGDDGPGISPDNLPRLSERFYRVEGQKSGERSGTGLGLAIVKHIVNRHHGGLAVESLEGAGATFTAAFPLAREGASSGLAA